VGRLMALAFLMTSLNVFAGDFTIGGNHGMNTAIVKSTDVAAVTPR